MRNATQNASRIVDYYFGLFGGDVDDLQSIRFAVRPENEKRQRVIVNP